MRKVVKSLVVASAMAVPLLAFAAPGDPGAGLLQTVHDFASGVGTSLNYMSTQFDNTGAPNSNPNTVGLCSYCHTPHSAITTSLLWNHKASTNGSYKWDDTLTTNGTPYATILATYKGPSVKCLSCHDGTVAIGDVALYRDNQNFRYNSKQITGYTQIGGLGAASGMKGNHPVAMPYPLGNVLGTYNGTAEVATGNWGDFVANPLINNLANGTTIKLYKDDGSGGITAGVLAGQTGIECSSCHDVHNKDAVDDMLLRGKINGSVAGPKAADGSGYLCLQCHVK